MREDHAALDGVVRDYADSPDTGEDLNCRCWADVITQVISETGCYEEREKYEEARNAVKAVTERFHDYLLRLDRLEKENNRLIKNAQTSLGSQVVSLILTLPLKSLDVLSELLRRYFGNIISNKTLHAADNFMRQVWAIKQEAQHILDQMAVTIAAMEKAAKDLENTRIRLEECEENKQRR